VVSEILEDTMCREGRSERKYKHAHKFLVGKLLGRRPIERLRKRWKNNIKTDIREI
jgi:hypothetical protein